MKLCVIGAGVSGLCAIKRALEFGCEVIAFEQSSEIGGTWLLREEVGVDKYGMNVHSSMYKGLTSDIPKEVMCYPDFPYNRPTSTSYISSNNVLDYLNEYATRFDLFEKIKFQQSVVRVRPLLLEDRWEVIVHSLPEDSHEIYSFDAVLVCTGNFHTPFKPTIVGNDLFRGTQIHSHDYRDAESFRNENVLVVGAGPSGIDIVLQVAKTAKSVSWSHHVQQKLNITLPDNVNEKPDIARLTFNGAIFNDNDVEYKYTTILYCTGYRHSFPFLSVDCDISVEENFIFPLFKHCLNINRPSLGFIGLPTIVCNNQVFDFQSRFCLKFMTKQLELPPRDEMMKDFESDMKARFERGITKKKAHSMGFDVQEKYFEELSKIAELEPVKPVIIKIFNKSILNLFTNLNDFRTKKFKVIDDESFIED